MDKTLQAGFGLFLASILVAPQLSLARDREVSVSGTCTRHPVSDRGSIILTAEAQEADLKSASRKATDSYERVRDAVSRLGLKNLDMQTVEYSVIEVKEWERQRTVSKGFRARMGLKVATSDIQRMGEVIAIGAREGIRDVGQLSTYLSQEKYRSEHQACLQESAEDAKAKADKLASALGAKVGDAVSIAEVTSGPAMPPVFMRAMPMEKSEAMAAPSVEAGQADLNVTVQVTFSLR